MFEQWKPMVYKNVQIFGNLHVMFFILGDEKRIKVLKMTFQLFMQDPK